MVFTKQRDLYLPGVSGNNVSTPDDSALNAFSSFGLIVAAGATDWTSSIQRIVSKEGVFVLRIESDGTARFYYNHSVGNDNISRSAFFDKVNGQVEWRAVTVVPNGATSARFSWWESDDAGVKWTRQAGTSKSFTWPFNTNAVDLFIGEKGSDNTQSFDGSIRYVALYENISSNLDPPNSGDLITYYDGGIPTESFQDSEGFVYTLSGSEASSIER